MLSSFWDTWGESICYLESLSLELIWTILLHYGLSEEDKDTSDLELDREASQDQPELGVAKTPMEGSRNGEGKTTVAMASRR